MLLSEKILKTKNLYKISKGKFVICQMGHKSHKTRRGEAIVEIA